MTSGPGLLASSLNKASGEEKWRAHSMPSCWPNTSAINVRSWSLSSTSQTLTLGAKVSVGPATTFIFPLVREVTGEAVSKFDSMPETKLSRCQEFSDGKHQA